MVHSYGSQILEITFLQRCDHHDRQSLNFTEASHMERVRQVHLGSWRIYTFSYLYIHSWDYNHDPQYLFVFEQAILHNVKVIQAPGSLLQVAEWCSPPTFTRLFHPSGESIMWLVASASLATGRGNYVPPTVSYQKPEARGILSLLVYCKQAVTGLSKCLIKPMLVWLDALEARRVI